MPDQQVPAQQTHDRLAAVRIPEYRFLLLGRFAFTMALRMMSTLVIWWTYQLTKNNFVVGMLGLSEFLPALLMALYSGYIVDRSRKKALLLRCLCCYILCASTLLLLSTSYISENFTDAHIVGGVFMVIFCTGIIRSFTGPCFSSLLATIVPRHLLQNATTWNQSTGLGASVTGHAMGGFLIALLGNTGALIIICALLTSSFIFLTQLKMRAPSLTGRDKNAWHSIREGLGFVFKTKVLLGAMSLDMFAVLFGGVSAVIPAYTDVILEVGPVGLGWLNAAINIGAIIVVILMLLFPMKKAQGVKLMLAAAGYGVCIIAFGLSSFFSISFLLLVLAGMLDGISVVVRGTVMQLKTPDQMRGRVSSVSSMFVNSSNELGQFESGVTASLFGLVPSVVFGGCMTLLVVIITWFKAPGLRKFEY